jgi:D-glycero-D-manno-heptose 1,7-bisphosphate phosphatase
VTVPAPDLSPELPCLTSDGQWLNVLTRRDSLGRRPALFVDRDGVLIEERGYLRRPDEVALIPGCGETLGWARAQGWRIVVVTNQSGIARGFFDWQDYARVEARLIALLASADIKPDAVLACPNHPDGLPPYDVEHAWRKPAPGMFLAAADVLDIDLAQSIVVGDKASDLAAGKAAGLRRGIHVATGHGDARERAAALALQSSGFVVGTCTTIAGVPNAWTTFS